MVMDTPVLRAAQTHRQVLAAKVAAGIPTFHQTFCPPFPLPTLGLVHLIQPSLKPAGARGDEIWTWDRQVLETYREANITKRTLWTRADILQAEICPATHPGLGTHPVCRNIRNRQHRQGRQSFQARQAQTLALLFSVVVVVS